MGERTIAVCDVCGATMNGRRFELRAVIVIYEHGGSRERFANVEVCGEKCLATTHNALVREVREAPGPDPATKSDCHSIAAA